MTKKIENRQKVKQARMMARAVAVDGRAGVTVPCAVGAYMHALNRFDNKGKLKYQRKQVHFESKGTIANIGATHRLKPEGAEIWVRQVDPPEVHR